MLGWRCKHGRLGHSNPNENNKMIPFYKPWTSGEELQNIAQAIEHQTGPQARHYTEACEHWLESYTGCQKAFLTPSCTAALEMAAILAGIKPGDEVIMSAFTFPAMANAFVLRGAIPVFVDIRSDTLNIDEQLIESAITARTRAIVVMHYGGVACEMNTIMAIAKKHDLIVIEDAAHAIGATYQGLQLGSIGHLSALSFHKTKNIQCGEGGALLINDSRYVERAEIIRENGTDRVNFNQKKIAHYSWVDVGSSFIMSEFSAAFLWAQINRLDYILEQRKNLWCQYRERLQPDSPCSSITHNAHAFFILANTPQQRQTLIDGLWQEKIHTTSHYQPLHTSEAGMRYGKTPTNLPHTTQIATTILRLPLWIGLSTSAVESVCNHIKKLSSRQTTGCGMILPISPPPIMQSRE